MNKKGISLMTLIITIVLIIILASITILSATNHIDKANKVRFQSDLQDVVNAVDVYNQRARIYDIDYESENLKWDGKSESAENTAKLEDKDLPEAERKEDTIKKILDNKPVPDSLKGYIYIENGKVMVKRDAYPLYDWAVELYDYMKVTE